MGNGMKGLIHVLQSGVTYNGHLPSASTRIKLSAATAGVQGTDQELGNLRFGKN